MGGINRLRAVMANDLAQAVQRPTRGPAGEAVPAFIGSSNGFAFVHGGAGAFDGSPRPNVERVGYALVGGEWRRAIQPMLDGTALGDGDRLVDEGSEARRGGRGGGGTCRTRWARDN